MAAMGALEEQFESVFQTLVPINGLSTRQQEQLLAQAEVLNFGTREFFFARVTATIFRISCCAGVLSS